MNTGDISELIEELHELAARAKWLTRLADALTSLTEDRDRLREALEPFAKAAMGVEIFDPDFPMDGAALRPSFDWYDKVQDEPLKTHSVRRSDLERARAALAPHGNCGEGK